MTTQEIDRIEKAINHIQTAIDVDPWAMEIAVEAMKEKMSRKLSDDVMCLGISNSSYCISRQAVEEMIKAEMPECGMWEIEGDKEKETVCEVCVELMQKLSELPPVTSQLCDDCISRQAVLEYIEGSEAELGHSSENELVCQDIKDFPSVTPQPQMGHCKDCKYFEYDSVAKVNGMRLIVAHEICKKWGDGCKTKEDGYCFLFESQESEEENDT